MVDTNKRNALKLLGGSAVIASVPSLAAAGSSQNSYEAEYKTADNIVLANAGTEMSIALSIDSLPTVTLTNHSKQPIALRHIHPGIVHAGANAYDLNSIFSGEALTITAGASRSFKIKPTYATQAETDFPRHLYRKQPQRVVAVRGTDRHGEFVNSSRSFYS